MQTKPDVHLYLLNVQQQLELKINSTPTGPERNFLTELNLILLNGIEEFVSRQEPSFRDVIKNLV